MMHATNLSVLHRFQSLWELVYNMVFMEEGVLKLMIEAFVGCFLSLLQATAVG